MDTKSQFVSVEQTMTTTTWIHCKSRTPHILSCRSIWSASWGEPSWASKTFPTLIS